MREGSALFLVANSPQMNFTQMHERLRQGLLRRVQRGTVSVSLLARQTGIGQAHLSNFLHGRRQLSLQAMDRILTAQHLSTDDLLPAASQLALAANLGGECSVPVVSHATALFEPFVRAAAIQSILHLPDDVLHSFQKRANNRRLAWQRFVAVRVEAEDALPMEPFVMPGATALIDRHYTSLKPYRPNRPSLFAVKDGAHLRLRFVEYIRGQIVLRPNNVAFAADLLLANPDGSTGDLIAGRVALVLNEL